MSYFLSEYTGYFRDWVWIHVNGRKITVSSKLLTFLFAIPSQVMTCQICSWKRLEIRQSMLSSVKYQLYRYYYRYLKHRIAIWIVKEILLMQLIFNLDIDGFYLFFQSKNYITSIHCHCFAYISHVFMRDLYSLHPSQVEIKNGYYAEESFEKAIFYRFFFIFSFFFWRNLNVDAK